MSVADLIRERAFAPSYTVQSYGKAEVWSIDGAPLAKSEEWNGLRAVEDHSRRMLMDILDTIDPRPMGRAPFLISRLSYELRKVRAEMRAEAFAARNAQ